MSAVALGACILSDDTARRALEAVREVGPHGAYIAAGFVRNRVWDSFYTLSPERVATDTDVVYFNREDVSRITEQNFEHALERQYPGQGWQVRNQARMHVKAGDQPYSCLGEALAHWPETATAVGVRLNNQGGLDVLAPFGLEDLLAHRLRPTPAILMRDKHIFEQRVASKAWRERWPKLDLSG